ncbi:hypothetical protein SNL152K_3398 [Streptomyces sp. NL15-2K]|nr:hypothetical protein SNL152K_3398 [Streptomyces sp. NL15-2K]
MAFRVWRTVRPRTAFPGFPTGPLPVASHGFGVGIPSSVNLVVPGASWTGGPVPGTAVKGP